LRATLIGDVVETGLDRVDCLCAFALEVIAVDAAVFGADGQPPLHAQRENRPVGLTPASG
jgi:hypothetical protein